MRVTCVLLSLLLILCLAASAQKRVSDDEIYDRVRLKLNADPDIKGGAFEVVVSEGVVTLKGKVEKEKFRQKAERLTKRVDGVKKVINQITIGKR